MKFEREQRFFRAGADIVATCANIRSKRWAEIEEIVNLKLYAMLDDLEDQEALKTKIDSLKSK